MEPLPREQSSTTTYRPPPRESAGEAREQRGGRKAGAQGALVPQCGPDGTSGAEAQSASAASEYDLAPRPEGHEITRIQHAIAAIRTAYFGGGGIYDCRKSAITGLAQGLEPVPEDSNLLLDLVVSAIGIASGGLGGFLTSKLLMAAGALLNAAAHPHNAIGPAPAPTTRARIVHSLAGLAVAQVTGKAKELAAEGARNGLRGGGDKPSVLAFVNAQVDALEELARDKNLTWDSAALELDFRSMPDGHLLAEQLKEVIVHSAAQAKVEQTVATLATWSQAYRERPSGQATLEVERDPESGVFRIAGVSIAGSSPEVLATLRDRGTTLKDLVTSKAAIAIDVVVRGEAGFTLPPGCQGEPTLPPDHITPSFFRRHGERFYGMGPNADPRLVASIAVHKDLLGAKL